MDLKSVLHLLVLTTTVELRSIQVYEDVDDTPLIQYNTPNTNQRYFSGIAQQDQQKWRYFQQQKIDARNRARNKFLRKGKIPNRNVSNIKKREVNYPVNLEPADVVYLQQLKPKSINLGFDHDQNLRLLQESVAEVQRDKEVQALNQLLGKAPNLQLEGLRQLLGPRDYTPITEDMMDFANPQKRPNIKVEPAPPEFQEAVAQEHVTRAEAQKKLKLLEQQLEEEAHLQAQEVIAKAHQVALAQVEAKQRAQVAKAVFNVHPVVPQQQHWDEEESNNEGHKALDLNYASQYAYGYRVRDYHSGNDFGHEEVHDGHTTKGNYHVLLPDGRLQHVQYWADKTGFHAKVTYDKVAQHPY